METLAYIIRLESAYSVNHFQYHLRRVPLIKKLFSSSYEIQVLKLLFIVISFIRKFILSFIINALYVAALGIAAYLRYDTAEDFNYQGSGSLLLLLLIFCTLIGGAINTKLVNADYNDHFAINMLRIAPKNYILTLYIYELAQTLFIYFFPMLIVCLLFKMSLWYILVFLFFMAGVKLIAPYIQISSYKKRGTISSGTFSTPISVIVVALFAAGAAASLYFAPAIPRLVIVVFMLMIGVLGCFTTVGLFRYDDYYTYFKRYYNYQTSIENKKQNRALEAQAIKLDLKSADQTSDKEGFAYMNELFLMRHHKVLMDPTRIIALIVVAIFVLIDIAMVPLDFYHSINGQTVRVMPFLPFAFYLVNRGAEFSAALFANCDRSMLNYSFYRKRKNILELFKLRLIGICKQNILPALACGLGFVSIEIISSIKIGNTDQLNPFVLIALLIAPTCVSICFSIHYLMLYYLLQPFDHEAKSKRPLYNIALGVTYAVCYMLYNGIGRLQGINYITFTAVLVGFCIVYSIISGVLVYAFAPKTFKNRR